MAARLLFEAIGQVRAQFVNIELRSIDDHVRQRAQRAQVPSLRRQRSLYRGVGAERRQPLQLRTLAHVHYQRGARNFPGLQRKFGKPGNQIDRQVVHAVVAQILERLQRRSLPRTAHARNDDQFCPVSMVNLARANRLGCRAHHLFGLAARGHASGILASDGFSFAANRLWDSRAKVSSKETLLCRLSGSMDIFALSASLKKTLLSSTGISKFGSTTSEGVSP